MESVGGRADVGMAGEDFPNGCQDGRPSFPLGQVAGRPSIQGTSAVDRRLIHREDQDAHVGVPTSELPRQFQAIHMSQGDAHDRQIDGLLACEIQGTLSTGDGGAQP